MNWNHLENHWKDGNSGEEWADWSPEKPDKLTIYPSLTQTFKALGGLTWEPRTHLFLGLNPENGGAEMMDLRRPRSFIIDDSHYAGTDILQTVVMGMQLRDNQRNFPITVLTEESRSWDQLNKKFPKIKVATTHRHLPECHEVLRSLIFNKHRPHFLVIDNLADLLWLDPNTESILEILIKSAAETNGVYVLASVGPMHNIKSDNKLNDWTHNGNILYAETIDTNIIRLSDNTNISVPRPE